MLVSQKLAIAAHLHVLLRRKTGRVTDTEWMAQNLAYAQEIIRYSRAKATEDGLPDLSEWADKLEAAVVNQPPATRTLTEAAMQLLRDRQVASPEATRGPASAPPAQPEQAADSSFADSALEATRRKAEGPPAPRYVGGIR